MADPHARKRLLISAAAILLLCLLLEGVIFQADALRTRGLIPLPLDVSSARITLEEIAPEDNDVTAVMPSSQTRDPVFRTTLAFENLELENICGVPERIQSLPLRILLHMHVSNRMVCCMSWPYPLKQMMKQQQ